MQYGLAGWLPLLLLHWRWRPCWLLVEHTIFFSAVCCSVFNLYFWPSAPQARSLFYMVLRGFLFLFFASSFGKTPMRTNPGMMSSFWKKITVFLPLFYSIQFVLFFFFLIIISSLTWIQCCCCCCLLFFYLSVWRTNRFYLPPLRQRQCKSHTVAGKLDRWITRPMADERQLTREEWSEHT